MWNPKWSLSRITFNYFGWTCTCHSDRCFFKLYPNNLNDVVQMLVDKYFTKMPYTPTVNIAFTCKVFFLLVNLPCLIGLWKVNITEFSQIFVWSILWFFLKYEHDFCLSYYMTSWLLLFGELRHHLILWYYYYNRGLKSTIWLFAAPVLI